MRVLASQIVRQRAGRAALLLLACGTVAADDTELFVADARQFPDSRPNVLLIMDTSGRLAEEVAVRTEYDATVQYSGQCNPARTYWRNGIGAAPDCTTDRWFRRTALACQAAIDGFQRNLGSHTDRFAGFSGMAGARWERLHRRWKTRLVECEDDAGRHGDGGNPQRTYPRNGDERRPWSPDPRDEIAWGNAPADRLYTIYEGNYLNWFHGAPTDTATRLQALKNAAATLVTRLDGVNAGLVATNFDQGGSVLHPMEDIATARTRLIEIIDGITAEGWAPLAETLYEAGQYFAGRAVDYGDGHGPQVSAASSRDPGSGGAAYATPLGMQCQKNFAVLLTGSTPTLDDDAGSRIAGLPGFSSLVGNGCDGAGDGACLDDMAAYLFAADLSAAVPGRQNVITHVVALSTVDPILESTAARGGGEIVTAGESMRLSARLAEAVTSIRDTQTTFAAMAVPVNSFNRLQHLDDVYFAVFRASEGARWPGNLKKYRLRGADGMILDASGRPAIDPRTGWFNEGSHSFWSVAPDGNDVALGGAAESIPDSATRDVLTYLGEPLLTHPINAVTRSNQLIDNALLGLGDPGDPDRDEMIEFMRRGHAAPHRQPQENPPVRMGDPLHGQPVAVTYAGMADVPDNLEQVIYVTTNDGYLHAIDARTGVERWAFIAPEFLEDQHVLLGDPPSPDKHYGIDGDIRIHIDAGTDGRIEPDEGERVLLFFGLRRGGSAYYALDVARPEMPRLLWRLDASDLPGLGQSWSTPSVTRTRIRDATQNAQHLVVVLGGGYDPGQDRMDGRTDHQGNALFMIDALGGELLWHAGRSGSDLDSGDMAYSIPADVRVVDLDADGFADRFYAADMGGQVWRFDVHDGEPAASLVSGGVIARLGGAPENSPPATETRRFYYAPDVALAGSGSNRFVHIGIGSGHRARPNATDTHDRFHALRDYAVFTPLSQRDYTTLSPITSGDLVDITGNLHRTVPPGSPGWRLDLNRGGWRGEKVLAESRTFNNRVLFTTYTPAPPAPSGVGPCPPEPGASRLYVLDLFNGDPVRNFDRLGDETDLTRDDRSTEIPGSIPGDVAFVFPPADDPDCAGAQCMPSPLICTGLLCLPSGFDNAPVRTYWSQEAVQ